MDYGYFFVGLVVFTFCLVGIERQLKRIANALENGNANPPATHH
jgi:hypothetical protein